MNINIENLTINVYIGDVDVEEVVDASEFTEAVAEAERKLYGNVDTYETASIEPTELASQQAVGPINSAAVPKEDYWDKAVDAAVKELSGVKVYDVYGIELEAGDRVLYAGGGAPDSKGRHTGYRGETLVGKIGTIVRIVDEETVLVAYEDWTDGHSGLPETYATDSTKNNHWFTKTDNLEWEFD